MTWILRSSVALTLALVGCGGGDVASFDGGAGGAVTSSGGMAASSSGGSTTAVGGEAGAAAGGASSTGTGGAAQHGSGGTGGATAIGGSPGARGSATGGVGPSTGGAGGASVGGDAGDAAADAGAETDAGEVDARACECTSGACCDGCHFSPLGTLCGRDVLVERRCFRVVDQSPPCQSLPQHIESSTANMFCTGRSSECEHVGPLASTVSQCPIGSYCADTEAGIWAQCLPCM